MPTLPIELVPFLIKTRRHIVLALQSLPHTPETAEIEAELQGALVRLSDKVNEYAPAGPGVLDLRFHTE